MFDNYGFNIKTVVDDFKPKTIVTNYHFNFKKKIKTVVINYSFDDVVIKDQFCHYFETYVDLDFFLKIILGQSSSIHV